MPFRCSRLDLKVSGSRLVAFRGTCIWSQDLYFGERCEIFLQSFVTACFFAPYSLPQKKIGNSIKQYHIFNQSRKKNYTATSGLRWKVRAEFKTYCPVQTRMLFYLLVRGGGDFMWRGVCCSNTGGLVQAGQVLYHATVSATWKVSCSQLSSKPYCKPFNFH